MSTLKERIDAYLRAEKSRGVVQNRKPDSSDYTLQRALSDIESARARKEEAKSKRAVKK